MTENRPLVSICSITYNHAPYIRQCLDGFLMQKTNFAYEILINDDCSTDGTTEIIQQYATKYPNVIFPVYHDENQYSKGLRGFYRRFLFPKARGKYIALCEGDDYWTDPLKLQKQVDFLEANPNYGLVYGKARQYDQAQEKFRSSTIGEPIVNFEDFIKNGNRIPTATALFRRDLCKRYLDEDFPLDEWKMGDAPLWLYLAQHSKLHFFEDVFAVYRILIQSASLRQSFEAREEFLKSANKMRTYFQQCYCPALCEDNEARSITMLFENAFYYKKWNAATAYYSQLKRPTIKVRIKYAITRLLSWLQKF